MLDWHQQTVLDYYIFYIHAVITQLAIRLTDYVNSGISKSKLKSFLFHDAYTGNTVWTLECAIDLIVGGALQVTFVTVTFKQVCLIKTFVFFGCLSFTNRRKCSNRTVWVKRRGTCGCWRLSARWLDSYLRGWQRCRSDELRNSRLLPYSCMCHSRLSTNDWHALPLQPLNCRPWTLFTPTDLSADKKFVCCLGNADVNNYGSCVLMAVIVNNE